MQKNIYDQSPLTWSLQGRLYQVEYAMEAVNQGNLLLGIRSLTHVVLVGYKATICDNLSYYPDKIFKVDSHIGVGIAGLTPDGRILYKDMRNECLNYNLVYNTKHPIEKIVIKISEKSQLRTQRGENNRPYGVGMLIAGYDNTGPRLFRTCPSGNYYEYICAAIGKRSQSASAILENKLDFYETMTLNELIMNAIQIMFCAQKGKVTKENIDVFIIGKGTKGRLLDQDEIEEVLIKLRKK